MAEAWVRSAQAYEEAAAWAGQTEDRQTQVDALRMAAWSYEQGQEPELAWAAGLAGLGIAETMTPTEIEGSTVSWLGELLLRLSADGSRLAAERGSVAPRLARLLG